MATILNVSEVDTAHCPAFGVNTAVEFPGVLVFTVVGFHVPTTELLDVVDKFGAEVVAP